MLVATLQPSQSDAIPPVVEDESPEQRQDRALVKLWLSKIEHAKKKWEPDFKRMRDNMEFVSGLQWPGQTTIETERYSVNLTLHAGGQKVATLYAKNPKAAAKKRERLEYQVWDGEMESLMDAIGQAQAAVAVGEPIPVEISALFNDFQAGKTHQKLVDKICKTLEVVYQYQVDTQQPDFKEQVKQVVRRVIIAGVGYGRPIYCRPNEAYSKPSSAGVGTKVADLAGRLSEVTRQVEAGSDDNSSAKLSTIRSLAASLGASASDENLSAELSERIEFDFLPATSVIPDPKCRALKGFVAASWVAIEFPLELETANAIFGVDIKTDQQDSTVNVDMSEGGPSKEQETVYVYNVFNKQDKTQFFVCKGYKDFLVEPEPLKPSVDGFWPLVALTFNDVEVEPCTKTSIFPPSDVQLMKAIQVEWNRTRDALRHHRVANAPRYFVRKGLLTDDDKEKLLSAVPNEVIELAGIPDGADPATLIRFMQTHPIDERLYDTSPLEQDLTLSAGMQQANIGAAQPNVTATVGSIAEQSRLNVSASNVDDLDGFLSSLARMSGEMIMQEFAPETIARIAGPGWAWPVTPEMRADYLNEILLQVEAASSGRPNKALDIANWRDLAPTLINAGASPAGIVQETVRRLDDSLDVTKFFPISQDVAPAEQLSPSGAPPAAQAVSGHPASLAPTAASSPG